MAFDKDRFDEALAQLVELSRQKQKDGKAIERQEEILKEEINAIDCYNDADALWDGVLCYRSGFLHPSAFCYLLRHASFPVIDCLFKKMLEDDGANFLHSVLHHDDGRIIKLYVAEAAKVISNSTKMSRDEFQRVKDFLKVLLEVMPIYCAVHWGSNRKSIEQHHHILVHLRSKWGMPFANFPSSSTATREDFLRDVASLPNDAKQEEVLSSLLTGLQGNEDPKQNTVLCVLGHSLPVIMDGNVPVRWSRVFFQHASYSLVETLFKKMIQDEPAFFTFLVECDGKRIIDHFVEDFNAVCDANTKLTPEDRTHVKGFLNFIQKEFIALYHDRRLNMHGFINICFTKMLPHKLSTRTPAPAPTSQPGKSSRETANQQTHSQSIPQQKNDSAHAEADKPSESKPSRLLYLWHKHWRSVIAIIFGITLVVLAFTPAGPALAAALTLKAVFTPVFAWIANIGLAGIGLGFGLAFSGFLLGLPSWITGMVVKAVALIMLLSFLFLSNCIGLSKEFGTWLIGETMALLPDDPTRKAEENRHQYGPTKSTWAVAFLLAIPFLMVWILEKTFLAIELTLLSIAELASRTFRKLGAWQARLFNSNPVAPVDGKGTLPNILTPTKISESKSELSPMSELHKDASRDKYRPSFYDHAKYYLSDQSNRDHAALYQQYSDTRIAVSEMREPPSLLSFIQLRAYWLYKDTFSPGQNPFDAAEEAAERNTASPKPL